MNMLTISGALALSAAVLAQSPCAPPSELWTTQPFSATHYAGSPSPFNPSAYTGILDVCDVTLGAQLTFQQIDVLLFEDALQPQYVGITVPVKVWAIPGTWVGNTLSATPPSVPAGWVQVSTGSAVIADSASHTACIIAPFTLPAGTYGLGIQLGPYFDATIDTATGLPIGNVALHPLITLTSSNPLPTTSSNQVLSVFNQNFQRIAWQSGTSGNTLIDNIELHFTCPSNLGYTTSYGAGCYNKPPTVWEEFAVSSAFDLANTSLEFIPTTGPTGPNYLIVPSASTITAPASSPLLSGSAGNPPLNDDDLSAPQDLGFTFTFPGGSTTQVILGSNGVVFLNGTSTDTGAYYSYNRSDGPNPLLAPFYGDLEPNHVTAGAGDVYFDVDAANQVAYATWINVAEWGDSTTSHTFQVAIHATGEIEYIYGAQTGAANAPVMTGWTPANGTAVPPQIDISASLPYSTGDDSLPPTLRASARPVTGTTISLDTANIYPGTLLAVNSIALRADVAGLDLGFAGMPGCSLYLNTASAMFNFYTVNPAGVGPVSSLALAIPANPALNGLQVFTQSGVFTSGLNSAGILVSDALCINIGTN
jgi:hypothetical protein